MRLLAIGSTIKKTFFGVFRAVRVDDDGRLETVVPSGTTAAVNVAEVNGNTVATTHISGTMPNEGTSADNDPHDGSFPVNIAGKVSTADPSYSDGDKGELSVDTSGRLRANNDLKEINGNAVATTGVNGTLPIEGPTAEASADVTSYPLQIGAMTKNVLSLLTDARVTRLFTDLYGRLHIRSAAYDSVSGSDQVSNLNLDSTNHDSAEQIVANVTNTGAGTSYYPSSAGLQFGDMNKVGWLVELGDCKFDIEVSNDGTTWVNTTKSLVDHNTGTIGWDNTHFTGVGGTADFAVSYNDDCKFKLYRFAVTYGDATNTILIKSWNRAV